ncbi:MAG: hypothetical protein KME31_34290, partial [Tolypothrix carrinoi HA7290-LM1]|nr:hypothetical protein [Tolypothrix carrinoi HA7290-LM1]
MHNNFYAKHKSRYPFTPLNARSPKSGDPTAGATTGGTPTPDASTERQSLQRGEPAQRAASGTSARHWLRNALPPQATGSTFRKIQNGINPSCGLSIDTACDHSIHAIAYNKVALVRSANVPMPLLPVF